MFSVENLFTV